MQLLLRGITSKNRMQVQETGPAKRHRSRSTSGERLTFLQRLKEHIQPQIATLEQLPNEILEKICEYLTFEERCKFGATNRTTQFDLTADKFWHKISIPNHILKYELINKSGKHGNTIFKHPMEFDRRRMDRILTLGQHTIRIHLTTCISHYI